MTTAPINPKPLHPKNTIGIENFNYTDFFNQKMVTLSKGLILAKYTKGVSPQYLRVLMYALRHYDNYLRKRNYDDPLAYDTTRYADYCKYLEHEVTKETGTAYTEKYIHFLLFVPSQLMDIEI